MLSREKMLTNDQDNKFISKKDVINLCILLVVALAIGVYLIVTTVVVAKDGVTYITYARNFEVDPVQTMIQEDQHPGFSTVILAANKLLRLFNENNSTFSWIHSAQISALIFRLLSIITLYFIGKKFITSKLSFWGVLILLFLPKTAEYGSNALSDWPSFFFLASSILVLMHGSKDPKWWLFAAAGLFAGVGFLFRPECAQVLIYGGLWLGLQTVIGKGFPCKLKSMMAMVLLLLGFLAAAGPYMHLKGAIFPKKQIGSFVSVDLQGPLSQEVESSDNYICTAGIAPLNVGKAVGVLLENIGQTVMWFFMPFLLIGTYSSLKKSAWKEPEVFYMIAFVLLNVLLLLWLYSTAGYMSTRHSMPLVMLTCLYVPVGLQMFVCRLDRKSPAKDGAHIKFIVLIIVGIMICMPKLLRPLHYDKVTIPEAAQWLKENTDKHDIISTSDPRIAFYADRRGMGYGNVTTLEEAKFMAIFPKQSEEFKTSDRAGHYEEIISFCHNDKKSRTIIIYEKKM